LLESVSYVMSPTFQNRQREDLVDRLLGVLLESILIELPDDTREKLLGEETGSWLAPHGLNAVAKSVTFQRPSLYWVWIDSKFCLNFLAHQGTSEFGSLQDLQWTLEACYGTLRTCDEPGRMVLSDVDSPLMIQSFWKVASCRILRVEFLALTLLGSLSRTNSDKQWRLNHGAVLSCDQVINLVDPLPTTPQENIRLAQAVSLLDSYTTPGLEWRSPPGPHGRFSSLADVLRCAYSHLEDIEENQDVRVSSNQKPSSTSSRRNVDIKGSITDSLVMTGGLVATGASFVTPIGAAVSVIAVGAKDGLVAAAKKGQASRGGEQYRVGDVTRGIVSTIQQSTHQRKRGNVQSDCDTVVSVDEKSSSFLESNRHRYVGVLGSSAGAAVGMAIAGPLGLLAGSVLGGVATKEVIHRRSDDRECEDSSQSLSAHEHSVDSTFLQQRGQSQQDRWRFGDNIRSAIQRGKEADGRHKSEGYKFGDLSRGLFSKEK
jgi:hypothetical protein